MTKDRDTKCMHCNKELVSVPEIVSARGSLYCSKDCAVQDITNDIIMNAKEAAIEEYDSCAEIVTPTDIGLLGGSFEYLVKYIQADRDCSEETARDVAWQVMDSLDHAIDMALANDDDDEEWFDEQDS